MNVPRKCERSYKEGYRFRIKRGKFKIEPQYATNTTAVYNTSKTQEDTNQKHKTPTKNKQITSKKTKNSKK